MSGFFPDQEERSRFHYSLAHTFLPAYVFQNPYAFLAWDQVLATLNVLPIDCTTYIQSRCSTYLLQTDEDRKNALKGVPTVFRRITDIQAGWEQIGKRAILIRMPPPEAPRLAFFVLVTATVEPHLLPKEPSSDPPVRFFTLERTTSNGRICDLREAGFLCEWTYEQHINHALQVPPIVEDFLAAARMLLST